MIVTGHVAEFDAASGLGTIAGDDGGTYRFHCITIADGTRTVETGRGVAFRPLPRFGAVEAGDVAKL